MNQRKSRQSYLIMLISDTATASLQHERLSWTLSLVVASERQPLVSLRNHQESAMTSATNSSCTAILRPCCRRILARRAASSYARPIAEGSLPVYDEALSLIRNDQERSKSKMQRLQNDLAQTNNDGTKAWLKERIDALELRSELYDPEIRWRARNGQGVYHYSLMSVKADEK